MLLAIVVWIALSAVIGLVIGQAFRRNRCGPEDLPIVEDDCDDETAVEGDLAA